MMYRIGQFFRIALTEWKTMLRDPACMLIVIVGVVLYSFYYPFPYIHKVANKAPVAIVDLDRSAMSRELIRMASSMQEDSVIAVYSNERDAERALANEEIYGFMKIPKGMEADLRKGNNVSVGVYTHGAFILLYGNVATAFATAAGTMGATVQVKRIVASGKNLAEAKAIRDPIPTRFFRMFNQSGGYGIYAVSAVLMIILQQTCLIGIGVMGGPRKNRHFRLLKGCEETENAPLLLRYFGRSTAFILHYLAALFFYKLVIYHIFDFPDRGDMWLVLVFGIFFFGATVNMGMWMAQFFKHRETALLFFACVPILVLFVSGFSWPQGNMPTWLRIAGAFFPSTYAIPAWLKIQNIGASFTEVAPNLLRLFEQSVFYLVLGLLHAKRHDLLLPFFEKLRLLRKKRMAARK